eukprot:scaffold2911_cov40-Tisochrysis_lutea.AAC.3
MVRRRRAMMREKDCAQVRHTGGRPVHVKLSNRRPRCKGNRQYNLLAWACRTGALIPLLRQQLWRSYAATKERNSLKAFS